MVLVGKATQDPPRLKRKTCCSLPLEKTWNENSSRKNSTVSVGKATQESPKLKEKRIIHCSRKGLGTK